MDAQRTGVNTLMEKNAAPSQLIALLIEAGNTDTVYRDVYLRRARELLLPIMDEPAYRAIGSTQKDIDELVRRTRSAVLEHDWKKAAELSGQADQMRKRMDQLANVAAIAKNVYDGGVIAFDPFSPGKHLGSNAHAKQNGLRAQILESLASLAKEDTALRAFYDQRRGYFSALELGESAETEKGPHRTRDQLQRLALEAVERGDITAAHSLATELLGCQDRDDDHFGDSSSMKSRYECRENLASPFPIDANRVREFGMIETHFAAALTRDESCGRGHLCPRVGSDYRRPPSWSTKGCFAARY